jgi:hypothetical protein
MSWKNRKHLAEISLIGNLRQVNTRLWKQEIYMCIICAAIPATAALGAKLNADQLQKPEEERKPIGRMTGMAVAFLVAASVVYHTLIWRN